MFTMKVEKQMRLHDRTLLLGRPQFDIIPKQVNIKNEKINVIGISNGVVPPFISLEIEPIKNKVVGETVTESTESW